MDSDISKLLVHLGGADASVLKHEMLSLSPTRRNVNAVLHGPIQEVPFPGGDRITLRGLKLFVLGQYRMAHFTGMDPPLIC